MQELYSHGTYGRSVQGDAEVSNKLGESAKDINAGSKGIIEVQTLVDGIIQAQ